MFWITPAPLNLFRAMIAMIMLSAAPLWSQGIPDDWVLVWSDEFEEDGALDPSKWTYDLGRGNGGWGNNEVQTYTNSLDNVRVEDGRMVIEVHQDMSSGRPAYTSGRVLTRGLQSWQYGRFEARIRLPKTTGTWSAFWMLATDAILREAFWPDNGEIDIMEHVGYEEDTLFHAARGSVPDNIHATLHTANRNHLSSTGLGDKMFLATATEEFNTYALNWTEAGMEFEVNGVVFFTVDREPGVPVRNPPDDITPYWPFDQRFHLIFNVAVGGSWGGHFNEGFYPGVSPYGPLGIDHNGEWPQRMEVEYVRVYGPPPFSNPLPVPGRLEADAFARESGMRIRHSNEGESAFHLGEISAGNYVEYEIQVNRSADYQLQARYSAGGSNGRISVHLNGEPLSEEGVALPSTGGSQTWQTLSLGEVYLPQGLHTLRLEMEQGGFQLARLELAADLPTHWGQWEIPGNGFVNTGDWLGLLNVHSAPWIYSPAQGWLYFPLEPEAGESGSWVYVPRP